MPIYETVLQEKPPVVLEIGYAYTKLGFGAEAFPRFIVTSQMSSESGPAKSVLEYENTNELYDKFVDLLQTIFFKHLLVSPKDRKIVIVESVFCPTDVRESVAKCLFRHFEVSSIFLVPVHLAVLATLAVDTALVVDLGYQETTVMPVFCGVQILKAFQAQPFGGRALHDEIRKQMAEAVSNKDYLTEEVVEDIKVRTSFVTSLQRAKQLRDGTLTSSCPDVDYPLSGREIVTIPGKLRESAMEILFPEDNDHLGLPYLILDAILTCPVDMRKILAENIVLTGGTAMIMGLTARLKAELMSLLESDLYKERLFIKSLKFHKSPSKSNYTAWLGGAIYGGTDLILTKSVTRENYSKTFRIPDWSNLEDNQGIV